MPAGQARSEETLDRLLDSAEQLLDGRPFSEITILEICCAADISSSSFYSRFMDKDAFVACLHRRSNQRGREALDAAVQLARESDASIEELVEFGTLAYVRHLQGSIAAVQTLRSAELSMPELGRDTRATFEYALDLIIQTITEHTDADHVARGRVAVATSTIAAALKAAVSQPAGVLEDLGMDLERYAAATARMWISYVLHDRAG